MGYSRTTGSRTVIRALHANKVVRLSERPGSTSNRCASIQLIPVSGGSMRSGNRRGGSVRWMWIAVMGVTLVAEARAAERVTTVPLGGSLQGQNGDRYFGVFVPTRFGGQLTIKSSLGKITEI